MSDSEIEDRLRQPKCGMGAARFLISPGTRASNKLTRARSAEGDKTIHQCLQFRSVIAYNPLQQYRYDNFF